MQLVQTEYKINALKSKQFKFQKNTNKYEFNENKKFINKLFSKEVCKTIVKNNLNQSEFCVIILDHINHGTSNELLKYKNIQKDNILIIEKDENIVEEHNKFEIPCHEGTITEFNDKKHDEEYNSEHSNYRNYIYAGIYLDFCGGKGFDERDSALELIKNVNLVNHSILGFTFSKRNTNKIYDKSYNVFHKVFKQDLTEILNNKGFQIDKIICNKTYFGNDLHVNNVGSPMHTFLFRITNIN